ncbi:low temperature requirement protein A [uncultured Actinomyces sp.]|uniref:low temperature requirement protein A n=1 Tax=uncultured Actinomyces sp. TaxID=249061 RepID=UPI0028D38A16|nr:low temperature requirement protein A [uncultured Actinomyces sp.]
MSESFESAESSGSSARTPLLEHRPVDTSMLFFDLVFVFAVTCLSDVVRGEPGWRGLLHAGILLTIVYWLWAGTTVQASMRDVSTGRGRLTVFAVALDALVLAIAIPEAFGSRGLLFALAYWVGRSLILGSFVGLRPIATPYHRSALVSGPLLVVGALAPPTLWREIIWGAAALVEVTALWHLRSRMTAIRYDAEHVVERFGALILIALGETLVAIGTPLTGAEHVGWEQGLVVAAAFALVAALWWAYFHHGDRFILMRFKQVDAGTDVVRSILAYGHLVLVAGIILVAVGFHAAVDDPQEALGPGPSLLLGCGTALFLAEFVLIRWNAFRAVYRSKLVGALGAVVLGAAGAALPALVTVSLLSALVVAIDAWEILAPRSAGMPRPEEFRA